ncbi:HPr family phosphocarrier protein, partial [Oceanicola sp. S124]
MSDSVTRELTIVNVKGLHARASAKFVEVVEAFDARAEV